MNGKILVVDDKQIMRDSVGATLQRAGMKIISANNGVNALTMIAKHRPDAVISDLKMPEMDGLGLLMKLKEIDDLLPLVLMTAYGTVDVAVSAMKQGAFDFVQKPFEGDQLVMTMKRAIEHRRLIQENAALKSGAASSDMMPMLIGQSQVMRKLVTQIKQISASNGTVLVHGESGVGKEVIARTIHACSQRHERVMLCVNCAALSSNLLESELFGHEKGSFTGAEQMRKGRFELADGGTILLDEISEISPQLQAKLLRVLQENQFERVGSSITMQVDSRVIATTNRDLLDSVADGTFRQDLYYRLNVLPVHVPPLRVRLDDVPDLANHFLTTLAMREGKEQKHFDQHAMELLTQYQWPGNVRELQNICERACVLSRGLTITANVIRPWLTEVQPQVVMMPAASVIPTPSAYAPKTLEEMEREEILKALEHNGGNRQRTARALGIGVRTLGLKLKKWKENNLVAQTV